MTQEEMAARGYSRVFRQGKKPRKGKPSGERGSALVLILVLISALLILVLVLILIAVLVIHISYLPKSLRFLPRE